MRVPRRPSRLRYAPNALIVDLSTLCNQSCFFCWRGDPESLATGLRNAGGTTFAEWDRYTKIIDDAVTHPSIRWLSLCGPLGEPCIDPDLVRRLAYASSKWHFDTILINTNGTLLDRHDATGLLRSCTDVQVSIDSVDRETYRKIHGKDHLPRVLENVRALVEARDGLAGARAAVRVRFTENEHNSGQWEAFRSHFLAMGVDDAFRLKTHSFHDLLTSEGTPIGRRLCSQPYGTVNFTVNGAMTTCCVNWRQEPTFGSIEDGTIRDLWESEEFEEWRSRRLESTCRDCSGLGTVGQRLDPTLTDAERAALDLMQVHGEAWYWEHRAACERGGLVRSVIRRFAPSKILSLARELWSRLSA